MENIIVYLIVIVIVVVNFIRNYQKEQNKNKERVLTQKPKPANTTMPATPPPFSRKHTETIIESQEKVNASNTKPVIDYPSLENYYMNEEQDLYKDSKKNKSSIDNDPDNILIPDFEDKPESMGLNLETQDDLRRAFVHSLIFNPKYF